MRKFLVAMIVAVVLACAGGPPPDGYERDIARIAVKTATLKLLENDPELAVNIIEVIDETVDSSEIIGDSELLRFAVLAALPDDLSPSDKLLAEELSNLIVSSILEKQPELGNVEAAKLVLGWVRDAAALVD